MLDAAISAPEAAEYAAQPLASAFAAGRADISAAAEIPTKTGIAHRLCTAPVGLGSAGWAGVPGGYPLTGSVSNSAAPIRPAPAPAISAGMGAAAMFDVSVLRRPAAPARYSAPVAMKFARWTTPPGPSASALTGWRLGS